MIGISENLEQHARKKHLEIDNIFQIKSWMEAMTGLSPKRLDPRNRVDVVKFAWALQDPLNRQKRPKVLEALPQGKLNIHKPYRRDAPRRGTWMDSNKCAIAHPEMNSYNKVQLRVPAVLGFLEFDTLHKLVSEELGRIGSMHKPFPLPSLLHLDPHILTSDRFALPAKKINAPLLQN